MVEMTRDINELHPKVKEFALKLMEECKKQGINMGISETYRTVERQDYLYEQGRTRPGAIITYTKGSEMQSYHQWRLAFDVYNNVRGAEYDTNILKKIGAIGMKLGLEWGGNWSGFVDTPHFQYTFGLSIKDLKSGKRPPEYKEENENKGSELQTKYKQAIEYLIKQRIINTPDAWLPEPTLKYVEMLIKTIGNQIFKVNQYDLVIKKLVEIKVINSEEIWIKKDFKNEYVKELIIKVYDYVSK